MNLFSFSFSVNLFHTMLCHFSRNIGLLHYSSSSDNIWLATQLCRTTESLIKGNSHEHSLRARLTRMSSSILCYVEPFQSGLSRCEGASHSARLVGDFDNAMYYDLIYHAGSLFFLDDLVGGRNKFANILHQLVSSHCSQSHC